MAELILPKSCTAPKCNERRYNVDCHYYRDMLNFLKAIEEADGGLVAVIAGGPRLLSNSAFTIIYDCAEEICIEVWT